METTLVPLGEFEFVCRNEAELLTIYEEVFQQRVFDFPGLGPCPNIIDCGSHIGVTVAFFKSAYPQSTITAFEPNPSTFSLLKNNVQRNQLGQVDLVNAAVSDRHGAAKLHTSPEHHNPWCWGDSLIKDIWDDTPVQECVEVPTVPLSAYIHETVDLLKLNVEGHEEQILCGVESLMKGIRNIILEYHGPTKILAKNSLPRIRELLVRQGFVVNTQAIPGANPDHQCVVRATR